MKLRHLVKGALFAGPIFFTLAAYAQPVNLTCKFEYSSAEARVTFDESAQTAGFTIMGSGPVPTSDATFTDTEIRWTESDKHTTTTYFVLNRTTGTLKESGNDNWHCTAAEKKF